MLGETLLIIGRQEPTAHGGFIDLLAVDETAAVHVIELKRDRTPRDVTAQTLDYGSWVSTLGRAEVTKIFVNYRPGIALEEAFNEQFCGTLPDEVNTAQVFTIVAASVDAATDLFLCCDMYWVEFSKLKLETNRKRNKTHAYQIPRRTQNMSPISTHRLQR